MLHGTKRTIKKSTAVILKEAKMMAAALKSARSVPILQQL
jgi:hypothetical protein